LNGSEPLPDRAGDVVACMNLNQAAREAYWGAYPTLPTQLHVIGEEGVQRRD